MGRCWSRGTTHQVCKMSSGALMYNIATKVKNPLWLRTDGNSMRGVGVGAEFWLYFAGTSQEVLLIN